MTPVTYKPNPACEGGMEVHRYGGYVSVKEYNAIKAELNRLRAGSFVTAVPAKHYERIIKAGDAVVADLEHLTKSCWFDKCQSVKRWNKVKEGK